MSKTAANLSRRQLIAGVGAGAAAALLGTRDGDAQEPSNRPIVFTNTTVVTSDVCQERRRPCGGARQDCGDRPDRRDPRGYPRAEVYEGRGKALFPGLINCHAHLAATLARGFNEDFGFPNSARLAVQPTSLLQGEEDTLMVTVGVLEAIRTGTTTMVENSGGIGRSAAALAQSGLRCVFAESIRDSENVAGPMSPDGLAKSETPRFSARLRDEGLQRINDLFTTWHGAKQGRISVFPAAALAETVSPELLQAVRAFAEQTRPRLHDSFVAKPGRSRFHAQAPRRPSAGVSRTHGFLGPRLFAAHCRYVDEGDIALLGRSEPS